MSRESSTVPVCVSPVCRASERDLERDIERDLEIYVRDVFRVIFSEKSYNRQILEIYLEKY